jgi:putative dimethyl sulfoxide reductase chaperone
MSATRNMPTRSDPAGTGRPGPATATRPWSVFGNYLGPPAHPPAAPPPATLPEGWAPTVDESLARAFGYQYLARAFEYPTTDGWEWLTSVAARSALESALVLCASGAADPGDLPGTCSDPRQHDVLPLVGAGAELVAAIETASFDAFLGDYIELFGHAARGTCPLNEIEYGELKADPLFQAHRLADLAAFYRAFGLELADDAAERQDHLAIQFEFMAVLAAAEAYAIDRHAKTAARAIGYHAQRRFLREHPGRWLPAFTRRLERHTSLRFLQVLARFTRAFVELDCRRFHVQPGSDELCLRPVAESTESLCDSCGVARPGDA